MHTSVVMGKNWPTSHVTLIERLQLAPDAAEWSELCEAYLQPVYLFVRRHYNLPNEDCEDIVQEVLIRLVRDIGKYDPSRSRTLRRATFRTWLILITRSTASASIARRRARIEGKMVAVPYEEDLASTAKSDELQNEDWTWRGGLLKTALDRAQNRVNETTFQSFMLYVMDEGAAADVAKKLRISVASVYSNKRRMIKLIRTEIARIDGYTIREGDSDDEDRSNAE
jgi:RNA polymerase sigma factor (sigma-70 family)